MLGDLGLWHRVGFTQPRSHLNERDSLFPCIILWHLRFTQLEAVRRGKDVSLVDEACAALVVAIGVAEQRRKGELLQVGFRVQIGRHG